MFMQLCKHTHHFCVVSIKLETGEMAQQSRACTALTEGQHPGPSIHARQLPGCLNSSNGRSDASDLSRLCTCVHILHM